MALWSFGWCAALLCVFPLLTLLFEYVLPDDFWPLTIYTMPLWYLVKVAAPILFLVGAAWGVVAIVRTVRQALETRRGLGIQAD